MAEACHRRTLQTLPPVNAARVPVLLRLALGALRTQQPALALEATRDAVALEPAQPAVRFVLGLVKHAAGDFKGANREFDRVRGKLDAALFPAAAS